MSDTSKKIKSIIKNIAPKSTFGTNPNDPWSAKAGIAEADTESGLLHRYLNSRGINPKFVSKDTKISHSKSTEFSKWKNDHRFDDPTDTLNSVTADKLKINKEEVELAEDQLLDEMINEVLGKDATAGDWIHDFVHSDNPKFAGKSKAERKKMALGAYYGKQNEEFEQLNELKKSTVFSWLKQQPVVPVRKPGSDRVSYNQKVKNHSKSWNRALDRLSGYKPTSENTLDSLAATEAPSDNSDMTNDTTSKSAKMVKDLKKKSVKEETLFEKTDKRDTVVLDIPLLIRILELAREDIKSDVDLHRVVERLIQIRNKGVLTMSDYKTIASLAHIKPTRHFRENHVAIAMGNMMDDEGSMVLSQLEQLERAIDMIRSHVGKDYDKQLPAWVQSKITLATDYVDTVGNYLVSKNENVSEVFSTGVQGHVSQATLDSIKHKRNVKINLGTPSVNPRPKVLAKKPAKKSSFLSRLLNREEAELDEAKTTQGTALDKFRQAAADRARKHDDIEREMKARHAAGKEDMKGSIDRLEKQLNKEGYSRKAEMSKSARMIKALYKKHGMKEELYDHEKEDKSVATYGKKPKTMKTDIEKSFGDNAPQAAAVLTGGKTLTGQTRDTLEIDPVLRKPSKPDGKQTDK